MEKSESKQNRFGLVGKNISYSFSKGYFSEKFETLQLTEHSYENFDLQKIEEFKAVLQENKNIKGLNVTIPYKQEVIPFLTHLDADAEKIGAVNTIKFTADNQLVGYNTDTYGFQKSIEPYLKKHHTKALILGTGGASKAIAFVFSKLGIDFKFVSRKPAAGQFSYNDITKTICSAYTVVVNCTPLGTHPNVEQKPTIPYQYLSPQHLLFDLIYNPSETAFLKEGKKRGAAICNGHRMLELQAEKAWEIWNT